MTILDPFGNPYENVEAVHKPSGHIILDGNQVADTIQCVHCGRHWVPIKGSGRVRGFCMKCNGMVCGRKTCHTCIPSEKRLEIREAVIK